jgi:hypothetical protein
MKIRRSLAIGLTAASLALAAIGGVSTSAATPQGPLPSETRDVVFTTAHVSDLETIIPTGLPNTIPTFSGYQVTGPDARS